MKTTMFKKLDRFGKKEKFISILKKKTNKKINNKMIEILLRNIDLDNQYKINFYDRPNKFKDACIMHSVKFAEPTKDNIIEVKEKYKVVFNSKIEFVEAIEDREPKFNTQEPYIFIKAIQSIFEDLTSDWYYSIEVYIPEK